MIFKFEEYVNLFLVTLLPMTIFQLSGARRSVELNIKNFVLTMFLSKKGSLNYHCWCRMQSYCLFSCNFIRQLPSVFKITPRIRFGSVLFKLLSIKMKVVSSNIVKMPIYLGIPGNKWPRSLDITFVLPVRWTGRFGYCFGTSQLPRCFALNSRSNYNKTNIFSKKKLTYI